MKQVRQLWVRIHWHCADKSAQQVLVYDISSILLRTYPPSDNIF